MYHDFVDLRVRLKGPGRGGGTVSYTVLVAGRGSRIAWGLASGRPI